MGWDVVVVTTRPHYNPPTNPTIQPLRPLWGGLLATSAFRRATVFHTAIPLKGKSVLVRIAGWIGFHFLSVTAAAFKVGHVDVILSPSPPLTIGVAAWMIGRLKRAPFIYNVQELFPDTAVSLGALREGALVGVLRRIERFIYAHAFAVTTIAPRMAETVKKRVGDPRKVRLIPNFVDTDIITPRPRDNSFSRQFGLTGRFTVVYAGNMGPAQGLEAVLDAAHLTRDLRDIVYVFVGEGTSRDSLERAAALRKLSNVIFIPQQPYDRVPDIYGASDLCVVPLVQSMAGEAVPSKVYRIMAAERCVLALTDKDSDLASVIRDSGAGIVVEPGSPQVLASTIIMAANNLDNSSGRRGRAYVIENADRPRIVRKYAELLKEAVRSQS